MSNSLLAIINMIFSKSTLLYGMALDVNRLMTTQTDFPNGDRNFLFLDGDIFGLLMVAIMIVTLIPITYYVVRHVLRPLLRIHRELKYVLEKNGYKKSEIHARGWAGRFAERLNQVIALLENKYDTSKSSYENLEIANSVLSYEKERIESVLNAIEEGILVTDCVGNIILVNRNMKKIMKLSGQQGVGETLKECFDNEEIISFVERNQHHGSVFAQKNLETELNQFGGRHVVRFSYVPLLSSEESLLGSVVMVRDITDQRIAQKNQSDFIAHVSHELITPLNTIKSYIEMLMDDEVNGRDTKIEFYNTINEETDRLSRLIHNLLNISKIEMGSLMINKDLMKSREFLEDILASLKSLSVSKKVKLESILPDKLSSIVMDKDLLHVAIVNILSNAIKYTPEGGVVTVRAEEDRGHIRIDVVDTGHGISEEDLPRIFDKFYRSAHESIQGQTGSGLGLALSRDIIRLHNGEIEVTSIIGQGTHFTVTLPKTENPRVKNYDEGNHAFMEAQEGENI